MKFSGKPVALLIVPCILLTSPAQGADHPREHAVLTLDGKSFDGRIRAKGLIGLFSVKGTLSFNDGQMTWSAKGSEDVAPYETEEVDGKLRFTSRAPAEDGTHVDWSGTYDGRTIREVRAIWMRANEDDFIHDLFLPDVVTLVFKPARNVRDDSVPGK